MHQWSECTNSDNPENMFLECVLCIWCMCTLVYMYIIFTNTFNVATHFRVRSYQYDTPTLGYGTYMLGLWHSHIKLLQTHTGVMTHLSIIGLWHSHTNQTSTALWHTHTRVMTHPQICYDIPTEVMTHQLTLGSWLPYWDTHNSSGLWHTHNGVTSTSTLESVFHTDKHKYQWTQYIMYNLYLYIFIFCHINLHDSKSNCPI